MYVRMYTTQDVYYNKNERWHNILHSTMKRIFCIYTDTDIYTMNLEQRRILTISKYKKYINYKHCTNYIKKAGIWSRIG
jgi:hypothetical protein